MASPDEMSKFKQEEAKLVAAESSAGTLGDNTINTEGGQGKADNTTNTEGGQSKADITINTEGGQGKAENAPPKSEVATASKRKSIAKRIE